MTKDGRLDKRIKQNKLLINIIEQLKVDGKFTEENKQEIEEEAMKEKIVNGKKMGFKAGTYYPLTKDGKPDMRYKVCKELFA